MQNNLRTIFFKLQFPEADKWLRYCEGDGSDFAVIFVIGKSSKLKHQICSM